MKSFKVKVSLRSLAVLMLVAASLLGSSYVMPKAALASSLLIDNDTTTIEDSTPTTNPRVYLADEPFAVGHYRSVPTNISEIQVQFTIEGNTTITVPNSTETITTIDTGQGNVTFLPGGGGNAIRGQIHMTTGDRSENATAYFTEFMKNEESTGVGLAYFSTSPTGRLAPLNNMIAIFLDETQPNGDSIVRFFEWRSGGAPISNDNSTPIGGGNGNATMTTTETPVIPTP